MLEILTKTKLDERVFDTFDAGTVHSDSSPIETFQYFDRYKNSVNLFVEKRHVDEWGKKFKVILSNFIPKDCTVFLAGGSVLTYILYGNEMLIRDFDFFIPTEEDFNKMDSHLKSLKPDNIVENENTRHFTFKSIEIDLIKKPNGTLNELLQRFDIDICRLGFTIQNGNWEFEKQVSFTHVFERTFTVPGMHTMDFKTMGIKLFRRIIKYTKKGFSPSYSCIINFFALALLHSDNKKTDKLELDILAGELQKQISKDYQFIDDQLDVEGEEELMPIVKAAVITAKTGPVATKAPERKWIMMS